MQYFLTLPMLIQTVSYENQKEHWKHDSHNQPKHFPIYLLFMVFMNYFEFNIELDILIINIIISQQLFLYSDSTIESSLILSSISISILILSLELQWLVFIDLNLLTTHSIDHNYKLIIIFLFLISIFIMEEVRYLDIELTLISIQISRCDRLTDHIHILIWVVQSLIHQNSLLSVFHISHQSEHFLFRNQKYSPYFRRSIETHLFLINTIEFYIIFWSDHHIRARLKWDVEIIHVTYSTIQNNTELIELDSFYLNISINTFIKLIINLIVT